MAIMSHQWIIFTLSCLALIDLGQCAMPHDTKTGRDVTSSMTHEKFRILGVFGHPGKSHFDVFHPLLEELGRRGHDITVISYFPRGKGAKPSMPNYHDISLANSSSDIFMNVVDFGMIHHSPLSVFRELIMLRFWAIESCTHGLYNPGVQKLIKSDAKFDLIVTEGFNSDCFLGFVHRFKAPFISLSSHQLMPWINRRFSNEDNPSYIPMIMNAYGPEMTFFQRTINLLTLPFVKMAYEYTFNPSTQGIVEAVFGPEVPPLNDIARNTSIVLVNTHFTFHGSKPQLPSIIEVGGIHISPIAKPLPTELERFLDEAHEGVLYFSFGSMIKASSMPQDKLTIITNVLGSIPRKVIWKWEDEDLPNKPSNMLIKKWLPQVAILQHPNVKVYMAHGGMLGLSEGVHAGVPMIVIPMFGDQFHNSEAAKSRGVAEVLAWGDFSENSLRTALDRVFNDTSYGVNARALSKAYRDRPESPLETAVWWTEYIARGNGIPYLRSAAQNLTSYQYYHLDVISFLAAIVLLCLYVFYRLVKFLHRWRNDRCKIPSANGTIRSTKKSKKNE